MTSKRTVVVAVAVAVGVLASVLGVMFSMAFGINVTILIAACCYLVLIPTSFALLGLRERPAYERAPLVSAGQV